MSTDKVDPEIVAVMTRLGFTGASPEAVPTIEELRQGARDLKSAISPNPPIPVDSVYDDIVGGVPARVYRPSDAGSIPTVVFYHGGGFVQGGTDTHDSMCRRISRDVNAVVVSVDYRLAPEHPFPAAYEDSLAAARYVAANPDTFGGGVFAVAGDSAGANLAASVAIDFRDEGIPVAAQLLAYPVVDASAGMGDYPSMEENKDAFLLNSKDIALALQLYLNGDQTVGAVFPPSPLKAANHRGLASAVIGVAENDGLRDQGLAYADLLTAAGVPVRKYEFEGLIHGFLGFDAVSTRADEAAARLYSDFKELIAENTPAN